MKKLLRALSLLLLLAGMGLIYIHVLGVTGDKSAVLSLPSYAWRQNGWTVFLAGVAATALALPALFLSWTDADPRPPKQPKQPKEPKAAKPRRRKAAEPELPDPQLEPRAGWVSVPLQTPEPEPVFVPVPETEPETEPVTGPGPAVEPAPAPDLPPAPTTEAGPQPETQTELRQAEPETIQLQLSRMEGRPQVTVTRLNLSRAKRAPAAPAHTTEGGDEHEA